MSFSLQFQSLVLKTRTFEKYGQDTIIISKPNELILYWICSVRFPRISCKLYILLLSEPKAQTHQDCLGSICLLVREQWFRALVPTEGPTLRTCAPQVSPAPPPHPISLMSPCSLFVQGNGLFDRWLPHSRLSLVALQSFSSGWSYPLVDGTQLQGSACVTCLQPTMASHCRRWAHILGGAPRPPVLVTAPLAAPLLCQPHPQPWSLFLSDPSLLGSSLTSMAWSRGILPFFRLACPGATGTGTVSQHPSPQET